MEGIKWNYFQYQKKYDYPVYLRCREDELQSKFSHLFGELGFSQLTDDEAKKISLQKAQTKILTIQGAGPRSMQFINGSDLLDKYGSESISLQLGTLIYTYRKVGSMSLPYSKTLWDLALSPEITVNEQMIGLRVMLVRFITYALSERGVLSYWGTVKDNTIFMMKQIQSFGEAVFIDLEKKVAFSNGGEMKLSSNVKIIRKDKEMRNSFYMSREDLIGFLSVNTCLMSFNGITAAMKKNVYNLSLICTGVYSVSETHAKL